MSPRDIITAALIGSTTKGKPFGVREGTEDRPAKFYGEIDIDALTEALEWMLPEGGK